MYTYTTYTYTYIHISQFCTLNLEITTYLRVHLDMQYSMYMYIYMYDFTYMQGHSKLNKPWRTYSICIISPLDFASLASPLGDLGEVRGDRGERGAFSCKELPPPWETLGGEMFLGFPFFMDLMGFNHQRMWTYGIFMWFNYRFGYNAGKISYKY